MNKEKIIMNDFELDCAIMRAVKWGELRNWSFLMGQYHMTSEQLHERWQQIRESNTEYRIKINSANTKWEYDNDNKKKRIVELTKRKLASGKILNCGEKLLAVMNGMNSKEMK